MNAVNDRVIVSVNMAQKNQMTIGGVVFRTAMRYEVNYREKSPVIAKVIHGNRILTPGDIILCHHNHFYHPSPYFLYDDRFSIPFNKTIFGILFASGRVTPVCGNIFGSRVDIETDLPIPVEERKKYTDRITVTDGGETKYRKGDLIFTRPSAPYDIVYITDNVETRLTKVSEDMIVGVEKKRVRK